MDKTSVHKLAEIGQSAWVDNISRPMLETGKLKTMIDLGLRGMTSNPTIFDKAISSGADYDEQVLELCNAGKTPFDIYDELTVKDVQDACDIFLPVYEETNGLDGYVSLEINPKLAYKQEETIAEGRRLFKKVNRKNAMFKVPATPQGFNAIDELTAEGINVNITLIFSLEQYVNTVNAYLHGIRNFIQKGGNPKNVHSVASVFVSRIDNIVDPQLESLILKEKDPQKKKTLESLKGKAAVANSSLIYNKFLGIFNASDLKALVNRGANLQRVLWGSTSTKNPSYSDIKYVTELIAPNTVNTMPENTFEAFLSHGEAKLALIDNFEQAAKVIGSLKSFGIDINEVCAQLLKDGVIAFERSFDSLLSSVEKKSKVVCES